MVNVAPRDVAALPLVPNPKPNIVEAALPQVRYRIENMDCPTEEALIHDKLGKVQGSEQPNRFNLVQRTLGVSP